RAFRAGVHGETVGFARSRQAGELTTRVTGRAGTTGSFDAQTTLVGDVNGDGRVNLADLQAFAPAFMSRRGGAKYNAAADFNQNGIIDRGDAIALLRNMEPLTAKQPLDATLHLAPQDQYHGSGPTISGGSTMHRKVTIVGRTTPGSLVIEDNYN